MGRGIIFRSVITVVIGGEVDPLLVSFFSDKGGQRSISKEFSITSWGFVDS